MVDAATYAAVETLREVLAIYFEGMSAVLVRHGGTIEKYIGDAIMAVFGLPRLHEDDALRAVRAAAEMRETLEVVNERLNQGPQVKTPTLHLDANLGLQIRVLHEHLPDQILKVSHVSV
jgi:class 3 adenylate cyclase